MKKIIHLLSLHSLGLSLGLSLVTTAQLTLLSCEADEKFQIKFAALGDYGTDDATEEAVSTLIKGWNPEFIITQGDNNYQRGEGKTIDHNIGKYYHEFIYGYHGAFGKGSLIQRFFPSLGNHDWDCQDCKTTPKPYLEYFALEGNKRYYDFVKGPIHFFCLDSDIHEPDGVDSSSIQGTWLKNQLASSSSPFKVVYFHHAPYSSGTHGDSNWMKWPFKQWGTSAIISGHEHTYERLIVDGLPYFVNGLGGKSPTSFLKPHPASQARYADGNGAMLIQASNHKIFFEFYNTQKLRIDSYSLTVSLGTQISEKN